MNAAKIKCIYYDYKVYRTHLCVLKYLIIFCATIRLKRFLFLIQSIHQNKQWDLWLFQDSA